MLQPALNWLRSLNDPLRNAANAEQWIAALPTGDIMALQQEALELVAVFPGARSDILPAQVEALLKVDARHGARSRRQCRAHGRPARQRTEHHDL